MYNNLFVDLFTLIKIVLLKIKCTIVFFVNSFALIEFYLFNI